MGCAARSRVRFCMDTGLLSLLPNPAGTFRCTRLSSDLRRVHDRVRMDVLVAVGADDEGLALHFRHQGCPRGPVMITT